MERAWVISGLNRMSGQLKGEKVYRGIAVSAGVCIAAASLSDATCTSGVGPLTASLALAKKFGFGPALEPKE